VVYDPFMGRGTTLLEAALMERVPFGCDANPLSPLLIAPRLSPPSSEAVTRRLRTIDFKTHDEYPKELLAFYHKETLRELCALKRFLKRRAHRGLLDDADRWIQMVALNRLTGHSPGFFSVYTLPPNQAVTVVAQRKINARRKQLPPRRSVPELIVRKTRSLLKTVDPPLLQKLETARAKALLLTGSAEHTLAIPSCSVALVVTSPPFLDVVNYKGDNWLRCWFAGIDPSVVDLTTSGRLARWQTTMTAVFRELERVLMPSGLVAFEVGEVSGGKLRLEEAVVPCALAAGLEPLLILINDQKFTKTANCWGVHNGRKGTNTNRVVLLKKPS
jgi:hypothetical protein